MTQTSSGSDRIRENRLRRMAARQGYVLSKSRRRDPRAVDYGGYFLADANTSHLETSEHGMDLDEVETFLTDDRDGASE